MCWTEPFAEKRRTVQEYLACTEHLSPPLSLPLSLFLSLSVARSRRLFDRSYLSVLAVQAREGQSLSLSLSLSTALHLSLSSSVHCRAGRAILQTCSHVTALEPVDCLRANKRTKLTTLTFRALLVKESSFFLCSKKVRPCAHARSQVEICLKLILRFSAEETRQKSAISSPWSRCWGL